MCNKQNRINTAIFVFILFVNVMNKIYNCCSSVFQGNDVILYYSFSQVQRLAELRAILWNLINYFVSKEGMNEDLNRYETVRNFHERFLEILCPIMHIVGAKIDGDSEGNQQK
jgi:hypothetical protein